jgi:hypothetical protein
MIKKFYIAFLESDIQLLVFIIAIVCLLVNQNTVIDQVEEVEIENVLVEDYDSESEEKTSSEKFMEDAFYNLHNSTDKWLLRANTELQGVANIAKLQNGHLIEVPLPPPEIL